MNNLLRSFFNRLAHYKLFYICIVGIFIFSAINILTSVGTIEVYAEDGEVFSLEMAQLEILPMIPFVFAALGSLFFGIEYSDGTMRNKLIIGKTRLSVYLSEYIVFAFMNLCVTASFLLSGIVGVKDFGLWQWDAKNTAAYLTVMFCIVLCFSAVLQLIFVLITNRAVSSVVSLGLIALFVAIAGIVYNMLSVEEYSSFYSFENGEMVYYENQPSEGYIAGALRTVMTAFMYILPSAQAIITGNIEIEKPILMCLVSLAVSFLLFIVGFCVFNEKDIK